MASSPKYEDMQWKPRGGWISLTYTCSTYKAIREKYDDLLDRHYISLAYSNVHQEGWAQTCVPFFHLESFYCRVVITLLRMQSYTRWYVDLVPLNKIDLIMDDKTSILLSLSIYTSLTHTYTNPLAHRLGLKSHQLVRWLMNLPNIWVKHMTLLCKKTLEFQSHAFWHKYL